MKKLFAVGLIVLAASSLMLGQAATSGINRTQKNQSTRIHAGIKSGELTKHEARKLRKQQVHIQREKKFAKRDGNVSTNERKHIKHDQKRASKNIAIKKHNRFDRRNKS